MELAVVGGENQSCSEYRSIHHRETNATKIFENNYPQRQSSMFSPKGGDAHPWNHLYIASPSSDIFPTAAQSPQALPSTAPLLLQLDFPEYASRSCSTRNGKLQIRGSTNEMWHGFRKNRKKKLTRIQEAGQHDRRANQPMQDTAGLL